MPGGRPVPAARRRRGPGRRPPGRRLRRPPVARSRASSRELSSAGLTRRNRWLIVSGALLFGLAWAMLAHALLRAKDDQRRMVSRLSIRIEQGLQLRPGADSERAIAWFRDAADLGQTIPDAEKQPPLAALIKAAEAGAGDAEARLEAVRCAATLAATVDRALARPPTPDDREEIRSIRRALVPFYAPSARPDAPVESTLLGGLDPPARDRVRGDAEVLLYTLALLQSRADRGAAATTVALGLATAGDRTPWRQGASGLARRPAGGRRARLAGAGRSAAGEHPARPARRGAGPAGRGDHLAPARRPARAGPPRPLRPRSPGLSAGPGQARTTPASSTWRSTIEARRPSGTRATPVAP